MKRFGMIQRDEGYPTEMVECDDGPFVLFDEVESRESLAVSAAVMQERQKIIAALQVLRDADEKHEGTAVYGIGLAQAVVNARPSPAVDVLAVVREYVESMTDLDPERGPQRYREALKALDALVSPTSSEGRSCTCDHDHAEHDEHRPWCGGPPPKESIFDVVRRFLVALDACASSRRRADIEKAHEEIQFDKQLTALRSLVDGSPKAEANGGGAEG